MKVVAFWMALLCITAPAQSVGVLLRAEGDVKIADTNGTHKAALAEVLPAGVHLVLARGAKASFLYCPQSVVADAAGPNEVTLSLSSVGSKSPLATRTIAGCRLPATPGAGDRMGGLTLRGDNPMVLISPANASVRADRVVFKWMNVEAADKYRLTVKSDANLLWEKTTTTTELAYGGPPLTSAQRYRWSVTALQGDDVLSSASAWMKPLTTDELRRLAEAEKDWPDPNDPARPLAMAFVYEELDMPSSALDEYRKISQPGGEVEKRIAELEKRLHLQ